MRPFTFVPTWLVFSIPAILVTLFGGCAGDSRPAAEAQADREVSRPASTAAFPVAVIDEQTSHTDVRLQAVFAVDERVVWASGLGGTYARTEDGGASWRSRQVPGAEELQFRDVHAFDSRLAYLLSAGEGEQSRIFKTEDGGDNWTLQYVNSEPEGFLDCFSFWDRDRGLVYGDSVDGQLFVLTTSNGGTTWERVPDDVLPPAGSGEGGFAASGTCVETAGEGRAWIGTGAGGNARVLLTGDRGQTWSSADVPMAKGDTAGVMSVMVWPTVDTFLGVALGGDLAQPETHTANVALTRDGGRTWTRGGTLRFAGAAYGGAWGGSDRRRLLVAVGPGGVDLSVDFGKSWHAVHDGDYWSVDFGGPEVFWAVGPEGRIGKFRFGEVSK